jgi:hypothetical protein
MKAARLLSPVPFNGRGGAHREAMGGEGLESFVRVEGPHLPRLRRGPLLSRKRERGQSGPGGKG